MFKISPVQDKALQKEYAELTNSIYCPDLFAYSMINQESGELMGFSQFDISGDYGYIHSLRSRIGYSDFEAMFILGRATMNFIDLCGTHMCYADKDSADERLLISIGFKPTDDGRFEANLEGMFDGNCKGHK